MLTHLTAWPSVAGSFFFLLQIPIIVRRYLPDGSYEDWKASELKQP